MDHIKGIYIVIFVNLLLRIIQCSKQSTYPVPRGYFWDENETSTCHILSESVVAPQSEGDLCPQRVWSWGPGRCPPLATPRGPASGAAEEPGCAGRSPLAQAQLSPLPAACPWRMFFGH